jgi:hypothetical protein
MNISWGTFSDDFLGILMGFLAIFFGDFLGIYWGFIVDLLGISWRLNKDFNGI